MIQSELNQSPSLFLSAHLVKVLVVLQSLRTCSPHFDLFILSSALYQHAKEEGELKLLQLGFNFRCIYTKPSHNHDMFSCTCFVFVFMTVTPELQDWLGKTLEEMWIFRNPQHILRSEFALSWNLEMLKEMSSYFRFCSLLKLLTLYNTFWHLQPAPSTLYETRVNIL